MKKHETDQLKFEFGDNAKFVLGLGNSKVFFGDKDISSCINRVEMDLKVGEVARARVHVLPGKIDVNHPLAEFVVPPNNRVAELETGINNIIDEYLSPNWNVKDARGDFVVSKIADALRDLLLLETEDTE